MLLHEHLRESSHMLSSIDVRAHKGLRCIQLNQRTHVNDGKSSNNFTQILKRILLSPANRDEWHIPLQRGIVYCGSVHSLWILIIRKRSLSQRKCMQTTNNLIVLGPLISWQTNWILLHHCVHVLPRARISKGIVCRHVFLPINVLLAYQTDVLLLSFCWISTSAFAFHISCFLYSFAWHL